MKLISVLLVILLGLCFVSCWRMISENAQNSFTTLNVGKTKNLSPTATLKVGSVLNNFVQPYILENSNKIFVFVNFI